MTMTATNTGSTATLAPSSGVTPKRRLRVALNAIGDLSPNHGARVYLLQLAEELARLEGVELVFLVAEHQVSKVPETLAQFAVPVRVPFDRSYWQVFYQDRIRHALETAQADVYHLPNTLPLLKKWMPTVVTIHDLADLRVRKYGKARTTYRRWVNATVARRADHIITVSENSKKDIVELLGIQPQRITVVHCGVSPAFRPLDREACRAFVRSRFAVDTEFVLAPGGLLPNKNIGTILASFAELRRKGLSLKLILTGAAEPRAGARLRAQISQLGLNGTVVVTSHVTQQELVQLYCACAVVTYPSLYEGFGLPAGEAMACGAPLVTSDVSSLPEVVGDAALRVNPRDPAATAAAIHRVLEEPKLRDQLVEKGFQRVQALTWRAAAEKSLAVYFAIMKASISNKIRSQADMGGNGSLQS